MKITHAFRVVALTAALWGGLSHAAPAAEAEKLLGQILAVKAKVEEIRTEQSAASADLNAKLNAASDTVNLLGRLPMEAEKIEQMRASLVQAKARVVSLERQLEIASITDPAELAEKKKKLVLEQAELRDDLKVAARPFEKRITEARLPAEAISDQWAAALAGYFRSPETGKFAGLAQSEVSWHKNDTGQLRWHDHNGKRVCWLSIFVTDDAAEPRSGKKLVDGKYPINVNNVSNIWVTCGRLKLALNIDKLEWQTSEAESIEFLKAIVDLDGLAALTPKP